MGQDARCCPRSGNQHLPTNHAMAAAVRAMSVLKPARLHRSCIFWRLQTAKNVDGLVVSTIRPWLKSSICAPFALLLLLCVGDPEYGPN